MIQPSNPNDDILAEFLNQDVKVPFNDAGIPRIARGVLVAYDQDLIKISGTLGTLIIGRNTVYKIGLASKR